MTLIHRSTRTGSLYRWRWRVLSDGAEIASGYAETLVLARRIARLVAASRYDCVPEQKDV